MGWFLPSSLTLAWWPSDSRQYFQFCFALFTQNIPNYLLYLNHSFLPDQLHGPPLIRVSGCVVLADVPSFVLLVKSHIHIAHIQVYICAICAIDKVSYSSAAISNGCHESTFNCKLPLYFPFCHSHYQTHQIHCEFENKKRKKGKTRKAEITTSSSAHCIDYCKMSWVTSRPHGSK